MADYPEPLPRQLLLFAEAASDWHAPLLLPARADCADDTKAEPTTGDALSEALLWVKPSRRVVVQYTANRRVILSSSERKDGVVVLRAHSAFRLAPEAIAEAAVRLYLTGTARDEQRRLARVITRWHREHALPPAGPSNEEKCSGLHHDLRATLHRVNRQHFADTLDIDITFGTRISRGLMGRHERRSPRSLIVINPVLDHAWITAWYLDFLVFHECLHEVVPPQLDGLRAVLHPPEFRQREQAHPHFERAREYEAWILGPGWRKLSSAVRARVRAQD
ncbi:MAG: hypothetical protein EXS14_07395 [Planctomycetes bacterium]|nr:hypothetical protein [Planctomycetota bacterium]